MDSKRFVVMERAVVYLILLGCFVGLSFVDLDITLKAYNPNDAFARVFEYVGEQPFQFMTVVASALLFRLRPKDALWKNILFGLVFAILTVFFAGYAGGQMYSYSNGFGYGKLPYLFLGVTSLYVLFGVLFAYLIKIKDAKRMFAYALSVVLLYALVWLVMTGVKVIWQRPRWRYLVTTDDPIGGFRSVWAPSPNWPFRSIYASFPSGHTMNAVGAMVLIPLLKEQFSLKNTFSLRVAVYLWSLLTALARIVIGAHFASDVSMGFILGLTLYDLVFDLLFPALEKAFQRTKIGDVCRE